MTRNQQGLTAPGPLQPSVKLPRSMNQTAQNACGSARSKTAALRTNDPDRTMADLIAVARTCRALRAPLKPEPPGGACSAPATARTADRQAARGKAYCGDYPIFLSYPVPKAVSPRLGLGAQASIRWTMYRTRAIQRSGLVNCGAVT